MTGIQETSGLRGWVDRWGPTLSLMISILGLIGLAVTIYSFFAQLNENTRVQRETAAQIQTLTAVLDQLRVQNDAATHENSIVAANEFWASNPKQETDAFIQTIERLVSDPDTSLDDFPDAELILLEQRWSPLFDCADSVSCDVFVAVRRKYLGRDACTLAIDRAGALQDVLAPIFADVSDPVNDVRRAVGITPIGKATCFCPFDEGGGQVSYSNFCIRKVTQ